MTAKEEYRRLCEAEGDRIPLFLQHWWMEAVCEGKEWDVLMARDAQGRPMAVMPVLLRRRCAMRYVLQPMLTQYSGPCYLYPDGLSDRRRPDFERRAADQLMDQLQALRLDYYCQVFAPEVTNWLPFYWRGYSETTRYTFRIDDISDPARVFAAFDSSKERQRRIRQAEGLYTEAADLEPEDFARFHAAYWHSRGRRDLLPQALMVRVMRAAIGRGQGLLLGLRDGEGRLCTAWFVVYDGRCAHALLSAMAEGQPAGNATALLVWRLIQRLAPLTRAFDFEGSMDERTGYYYRSFGARQVPLMQVSLCRNPLFKLLLRIKG